MKSLRVLALTRYGPLGASSRLRSLQYKKILNDANILVDYNFLVDDLTLELRYKQGSYGLLALLRLFGERLKALLRRDRFDLIWIEKEALPWWPLWAEAALLDNIPYVLDYDDAIFHNYDLHRWAIVRSCYGRKLDGLMTKAALVVGGNDYLAQRALDSGSRWVEVLPTVIDLERYPKRSLICEERSFEINYLPKIVWIGSPSTVRYLRMLQTPLQQLAKKMPFLLRVIGGDIEMHGVQIECYPWSEGSEVFHIASADVGVMPLLDSPWERGKCGYKLIQFMACGLPVVASPVGVNAHIVQAGVNGFLAEDSEAWFDALERLLTDSSLRMRMGSIGRQHVDAEYCLQVTGPKLAGWLRKAAQIGL